MSKVFTITEGLENMGALKTGGQGSVYKAKRTGTIITAVKLLPTPIFNESLSDKNYTDFRNEVQKLKRVNEEPNPNVVKILSSGITETGSFPFIEMEFIEGPDLEELLRLPHDPVFTIKEAIKVAEHLAHAIAHCHKAEVKHGDIKSNNVKLNIHTGNYVLLDFGLAVMNDEQRRTSLRQAGAIEFMAPEQGNGDMLYQTDVYSFGVILFELLAGQVPFPLQDKSETARNLTMVAHMETPPPDMMELRRKNMPPTWETDKQQHEANVPQWLIAMIYRCLEKKPEKRFENGIQLYEYALRNSTAPEPAVDKAQLLALQQENDRLKKENQELQNKLNTAGPAPAAPQFTPRPAAQSSKGGGSRMLPAILGIAAVIVLLVFLLRRYNKPASAKEESTTTTTQQATPSSDQYKVVSKRAYFYNEPDPDTRRNAYLIPSGDVITAQKEQDGFVYVVFTNDAGQTSKGWVQKKDLQPVTGNDDNKDQGPHSADQVRRMLKEARSALAGGNQQRAITIYGSLIDEDVPEAMYQYANLALQNVNKDIDCKEAVKWLSRAVDEGYAPAKRTLGFLYLFGENDDMVSQYHYTRCHYKENHEKGSKLLMDAALDGDTAAQRFLDMYQNR